MKRKQSSSKQRYSIWFSCKTTEASDIVSNKLRKDKILKSKENVFSQYFASQENLIDFIILEATNEPKALAVYCYSTPSSTYACACAETANWYYSTLTNNKLVSAISTEFELFDEQIN